MSQITSSAYPVTTESQEGDLFPIVRNGQLYKLSRSGLESYIQDLIDDTMYQANVATTAQLDSLESDVNTTGKYQGKFIFNTSTNKPVYSVGSAAASVWVDATGATAHTPV